MNEKLQEWFNGGVNPWVWIFAGFVVFVGGILGNQIEAVIFGPVFTTLGLLKLRFRKHD